MIVPARKTLTCHGRPASAGAVRWFMPTRDSLRILAVSLIIVAVPGEISAQTNAVDLTELPLETLMNLDVQIVYGASRL